MSSLDLAAGDGPDALLCFSIHSTGFAFNRIYKPLLDKVGLTYPQYLVLVALWAKNDQTVGMLGEQLFLESSTLTPLLKRIESLGFVTRTRDTSDERVVRVTLTPAGEALRDHYADIRACVVEATGLTEEEMGHLHQTILKLRRHLRNSVN